MLFHPAIQAGISPFLLSLTLAILMMRLTPRISELAPILAFLVAFSIIYEADTETVAWVPKLVVICISATLLGSLLDRLQMHPIYLGIILWLLGMAGGAWVILPEFMARNSRAEMALGIVLSLYPAWTTWGMSKLRFRPIQAYSALTILGLGTGIGAVFGKSLLTGQFALAMGFASAIGIYLILIAKWEYPTSLKMTLPAGITLGVLGASASAYASFSPVSLVVLALIPLIFLILADDAMDSLGGFLFWSGLALVITAVAVFLAYVGVIRGYI